MKFTLTCETISGEKVTHEFKADFLKEVLHKTHLFLKGVGFQYEGELTVENENSNGMFLDLGESWNNFDGTTAYDTSPFSAVINDHMKMTELYDDIMKIDLSEFTDTIKVEETPKETCGSAGCGKCGCGKNAN